MKTTYKARWEKFRSLWSSPTFVAELLHWLGDAMLTDRSQSNVS